MTLAFWLKVSRPGLWFPTVWLYFLPLGGRTPWDQPAFWVGLAFVTFPLNLIVYGWNDLVDGATDRINPRKDSYLFGAAGTDDQLAQLPRAIALTSVVSAAVLAWFAGPAALAILAGVLLACLLYNHPRLQWRSRPPLELLCQAGYLLVVPLSVALNDVPHPGWTTYLYLGLFTLQSQLMGEVMDVDPDREAGRQTTATVLGVGPTKLLIIAVVLAESAAVWWLFREAVFAVALLGFAGWLLLDRFVLFKTARYTRLQMQLFGVGTNVAALVSMVYVWQTGCLLR